MIPGVPGGVPGIPGGVSPGLPGGSHGGASGPMGLKDPGPGALGLRGPGPQGHWASRTRALGPWASRTRGPGAQAPWGLGGPMGIFFPDACFFWFFSFVLISLVEFGPWRSRPIYIQNSSFWRPAAIMVMVMARRKIIIINFGGK